MQQSIDVEARNRLIEILDLEPARRKQVIKIILYHGQEQGLEEGVRDLLKLCCSDKYAAKVMRALI
jgi:hypothetical protein